MRKIRAALAGLVLFGVMAAAQGQYDFNNPSIPGAAIMNATSPSSSHSISLTLVGLEYSYEKPVGGYWTLVFRGGFPVTVTDYVAKTETETHTISDGTTTISHSNSSSSTTYYFGPRPGISIEPRYYTSMERRNLLGRNTANNSANFVSVITKLYTAGFQDIQLSVVPVYGIRRSGQHWFREYAFGAGWHSISGGIIPHVNLRIGYLF